MSKSISPIIETAELLALYQTQKIILIDATSSTDAKSKYQEKHLQGALFVDLNTQLADIKDDLSQGGRHPLPSIEKFSKTLSELGISEESHVVIYDDNTSSNAAARFWWMLKAVGHEKVQVLNGGMKAAEKKGFPTSNGIEEAESTKPYKIETWTLPLADITEVENVSQDKNHLIIDVRDTDRYNGDKEPIDLIAGHIPGAINVPYVENLDQDGLFLSPSELKKKYEMVFGEIENRNIIVHCGSGVTACHTLLAIAYAGIEIPKLYVGSWSEWSRNNKTIAVRKDKE